MTRLSRTLTWGCSFIVAVASSLGLESMAQAGLVTTDLILHYDGDHVSATGGLDDLTGWRGFSALVQLLPYLEQENVASQIDYQARIWDQSTAWKNPMPVYCCPSDGADGRCSGQHVSRSNAAFCVGTGASFKNLPGEPNI